MPTLSEYVRLAATRPACPQLFSSSYSLPLEEKIKARQDMLAGKGGEKLKLLEKLVVGSELQRKAESWMACMHRWIAAHSSTEAAMRFECCSTECRHNPLSQHS